MLLKFSKVAPQWKRLHTPGLNCQINKTITIKLLLNLEALTEVTIE